MTRFPVEFPTGVKPVKLYLPQLAEVFTVAKFRLVVLRVMTLTFWRYVLLFPCSR
jgi:hypothetical protein